MPSPSRLLLCLALLAGAILIPATTAMAVEGPDLSLTITHAPDPVAAGDDVDFTFTVTNNGPGTASQVMVEYGVAGGTRMGQEDGGIGYGDGGRYLMGMTGSPLPEGGAVSRTVYVRTNTAPNVTVDGVVSAYETDPVTENNARTKVVPVAPATRNTWKHETAWWSRTSGMWGQASAYHSTAGSERTGRGVVVGGLVPDDTIVLNRWVYTWTGFAWDSGGGTSSHPPAHMLSAMTYNPADKTLVLFGGLGDDGILGDTWTMNENMAWTKRTPATSPPPRAGAAMAVAGGKVVLFSGATDTDDLGDTWTWDGVTWTRVATPVAPSARTGMTFATDEARGVAVLFSGCCTAGGDLLSDTWIFNGTSWTKKTPAVSPPSREMAGAAFDRFASAVALYGGVDNDGTVLGDLWTWNGSAWHTVATAGEVPAPRESPTLIFAGNTRSEPGRLVLWGGIDQDGVALEDARSIALSGPSATIEPPALTFGALPLHAASVKIATVTNVGTEPLSVTGVAIGNANAGDFTADASECATPLAPSSSCTINVTAVAKGSGARSALLTVRTDAGSTLAVALSATGVAPALTTPGLVSAKSVNASFPVSWRGDAGGVVYDVEWMERYRTSSGAYRDGTWRRWKTGVGAGTAWFGGSGQPASVPGHTYIFRVRARSGSATGPWSAIKSAIVPVDDRSNWLGWSSGWSSQTVSGRYFATQRTGTTARQWMTLLTDTNLFTIVGERCASCGQFRVYVDGALVATVDTYSRSTAYRQTLYSRYLPGGIRRHSLRIVPVGTARRPSVKIDAIGLAR